MCKGARETVYLVRTPAPYLIETKQKASGLWGWWRATARVPEAVIDLRTRVCGGVLMIRVEVSPTGRSFTPLSMVHIGRVSAKQRAGGPECGADSG